jgi:hydroxyacylglutathione hydrolase
MPELKAAVIPVTPFQQNCTLLWEEPDKRALVIDPGGEVPRILEAISKHGLRPERILLTHGHIDHAGGAAELKEALEAASGAPVPLAPGSIATVPIEGPDARDQFILEGLEAQAARFGMTGIRNVLPDRWLAENDEIQFGSHRFAVLHCPGHTPGHLVFVNHAARFALVGDVLFRGSVGRTDFPYGDHDALIRAITDKLLPLGDDFSFFCGHGPGSTLGAERRTNPFLQG